MALYNPDIFAIFGKHKSGFPQSASSCLMLPYQIEDSDLRKINSSSLRTVRMNVIAVEHHKKK